MAKLERFHRSEQYALVAIALFGSRWRRRSSVLVVPAVGRVLKRLAEMVGDEEGLQLAARPVASASNTWLRSAGVTSPA